MRNYHCISQCSANCDLLLPVVRTVCSVLKQGHVFRELSLGREHINSISKTMLFIQQSVKDDEREQMGQSLKTEKGPGGTKLGNLLKIPNYEYKIRY